VQCRIPCTVMRGGTSRGLFFLEKDLPGDPKLRDRVLLAAFGSPDPKQIDGLGGAVSVTSNETASIHQSGKVTFGHPEGLMTLEVNVEHSGPEGFNVVKAGVERTARRIMDGYVYIPQKIFQEEACL